MPPRKGKEKAAPDTRPVNARGQEYQAEKLTGNRAQRGNLHGGSPCLWARGGCGHVAGVGTWRVGTWRVGTWQVGTWDVAGGHVAGGHVWWAVC